MATVRPTARMTLAARRRCRFAGSARVQSPAAIVWQVPHDRLGPWVRGWRWYSGWIDGDCYRTPHLHAASNPSGDGTETWLTWSAEQRVSVPMFVRWQMDQTTRIGLWRFL